MNTYGPWGKRSEATYGPKPTQPEKAAGIRLTLTFGETEHEGDLDYYGEGVISSGGKIVSQRVLEEKYDHDGDVEDYETGEMVIEVPHDRIASFAEKFPKTPGGEMAGFSSKQLGELLTAKAKKAAAPKEEKKPAAAPTDAQRAAAKVRAEQHERLEAHHKKEFEKFGGLIKAAKDGREGEARAQLEAASQHKHASYANKSAAAAGSIYAGPSSAATVARAEELSAKAQKASEAAHTATKVAAAKAKEEKPPPKAEPPPPAAPLPDAWKAFEKKPEALAKYAQAKKLPGSIETGKRGGQFYTTATGAKVYVKK